MKPCTIKQPWSSCFVAEKEVKKQKALFLLPEPSKEASSSASVDALSAWTTLYHFVTGVDSRVYIVYSNTCTMDRFQ